MTTDQLIQYCKEHLLIKTWDYVDETWVHHPRSQFCYIEAFVDDDKNIMFRITNPLCDEPDIIPYKELSQYNETHCYRILPKNGNYTWSKTFLDAINRRKSSSVGR
jgi:hypothetical protein